MSLNFTFDPQKEITIAVLGGHSALELCEGAKRQGFRTLVVAQKGRERVYQEQYRVREVAGRQQGCVDEVIVVDAFKEVSSPAVQKLLQEKNAIMVHNRYFWVYCDFDEIEKDFHVPIYGSRNLVRLEERDHPMNQYKLLAKAGIRTPKILKDAPMPEGAWEALLQEHFSGEGGPLIVKVNEAIRRYERAFFVVNSVADYKQKSEAMLSAGKIIQEDLDKATVEEFIIGAQVNFNFFYSPLHKSLELMGTDARRQTSLDGFLRLTAETQMDLLSNGYAPSMVETGHFAVTVKESLLEKIYDIGERFVKVCAEVAPQPMIGPFALQGAVDAKEGREELVIFDVSMRIPGSPGTRFTPYSAYLHGQSMSYGERMCLEIREALHSGRIWEILT